ncbi:MAG: D-2-hydroxyacid dehydrogenase [Alcanivoracaceae bacterium]|nr:D-2-hydroxyacid dehydrogenase [Alcanivoracaceae bacterium]
MRGVFLDTQTMAPESLDFSALTATLPDWQLHDATAAGALQARLADADVVITNKVVLDRAALASAPRLKLVCVSATGTNNVDTEAARELGIPVCNVSGYAGPSVAQHTLALMLGLATRWHEYRQDVQHGAWSRSPMFCLMHRPVVELHGKHLVIVGAGALGKAVAALAQAFGMRVTFAASLAPGAPADPARPPLQQLLPQADWVSLHCPLTLDTQHLVDRGFLAQMPAHGFLINTARGGLVDEPALAEALREGRIAGAALDVLGVEPPPADHPLLAADIPNLLLTPHNAWVSRECRQRLLDGVTANIRAWQAGRLENCVNGLEMA